MNGPSDSWDRLSETWQRQAAPPATDVTAIVRAREAGAQRRLWLLVAMEVAIVAVVVVFTAVTIAGSPGGFDYVHIAAAWATVVAALIFTIRNRRGIWRPAGDSTAEFLATAERRAHRKLRTARFAMLLVAAQSLVVLAMLAFRVATNSLSGSIVDDVLVLLFIVGIYVGWALWFRQRALRELREVRELRSECLGGDGHNEPL